MIFGHRHKDEAVAIGHRSPPPFSTMRITDILWRCTRCGAVHSQELAGEWTLAQVRGETVGPPLSVLRSEVA